MRIGDLIEKKKRKSELDEAEIRWFIEGYVSKSLPDYQVSALLMAIWWAGMSAGETTSLTTAMAASGDRVDLSGVAGTAVDKHSTGGVADTTTLIVAPVVAACGGYIAKMSGRGLGHTGGTLDKLEAIPGLRVDLSTAEFIDAVNRCGLAIVGQSGNLVPADKQLYSLRDVTGTVDSIPLIASSVMSKKLAAGAAGIVLDVKCGTGAFMRDADSARELAEMMVAIGNRAGRRTVALVTDMNQPLGRSVGNALDVAEAITVLRGDDGGDLLEVSLALAAELLVIAGIEADLDSAKTAARKALESGAGLERLRRMIEQQHGDPRVVDDLSLLPHARRTVPVTAGRGGTVSGVDAEAIGRAAQLLGAGRLEKDDPVDPAVGVEVGFRLGEKVSERDRLYVLHVNDESRLEEVHRLCLDAVEIGEGGAPSHELIRNRIDRPPEDPVCVCS